MSASPLVCHRDDRSEVPDRSPRPRKSTGKPVQPPNATTCKPSFLAAIGSQYTPVRPEPAVPPTPTSCRRLTRQLLVMVASLNSTCSCRRTVKFKGGDTVYEDSRTK